MKQNQLLILSIILLLTGLLLIFDKTINIRVFLGGAALGSGLSFLVKFILTKLKDSKQKQE